MLSAAHPPVGDSSRSFRAIWVCPNPDRGCQGLALPGGGPAPPAPGTRVGTGTGWVSQQLLSTGGHAPGWHQGRAAGGGMSSLPLCCPPTCGCLGACECLHPLGGGDAARGGPGPQKGLCWPFSSPWGSGRPHRCPHPVLSHPARDTGRGKCRLGCLRVGKTATLLLLVWCCLSHWVPACFHGREQK